jgi:DNA-binding transcriptional regulator YiaG
MPTTPRATADLLTVAREAAESGLLRAMRLDRKLTQEESGAVVGVSGPAWARWEHGDRVPRGEPAVRLGRWVRSYQEARTK